MTANHSPNTDLLFEHFATLATAPDGIARLRELILQLAVQGKLGTQDAGDEPAKILPRITKEHKNESDGKTRKKKENVGDPIDLDNVSSSCIQIGWTICRLSDCLELINGRAYSMPELLSEGTPIIRIQNLNGGKDWYYSNLNLEPDKYCDDGDLLFAWSGTFGPYIWNGSKSIYHYHIWKIKLSNSILDSFAFYLLKHLSDKIRSASHGLMLPHMTKQDMENVLIRLPPLAEQHRIVAKVDRLMALCDELEARQQQERAGCLKLGTASLAGLQNATHPEEFGRLWAQMCDAFDLILDCPENVAVLRQTILQLAVQGKLGTQEPGDEPAGKLVERIRSNKLKLIKEGIIKKEKVIEPVKETEGFFSLPSGWSWIKLYDMITFGPRNGYSPMPAINTTSTKVLTLSATTRGVFDNRYYKYLNEKIDENSHLWLNEGDILIQRSNTPGYVGISAIYHGDSNLFIYPDMMMKFRLSEEVNSDFIHKVINCGYSRNYFTSIAIGTSGSMKKINQNIVENLIIPLPPLSEQHRIVAKVDALMALCDALESRLKERAGVQGRLAGAVVKLVAG